MSTEKLFYADSYLKEAECTVIACEAAKGGWTVELDRTIFYPTGGGQPCDLGVLGAAQVLDVSEKGGRLLHLCDRALPVGETVVGKIDWERRFMLMQQHSGEHIVSGIIHERFGYDNVGFHMGSDAITIDFSGEISQAQMQEVELAANQVIWQDLERKILFPDAESLRILPYRSKKELTGEVRIVKFPGVDLCACCGLHVARTGEIGLIKLLSTTRFHSGSRMELLCGGRALEWLNMVAAQNRAISGLLSAKPNQTAAAVRRQSEELHNAQFRAVQTENRLFAKIAEDYTGAKNVLHFEESLSPDGVRRLADAIATRACGRVAVFSQKECGFSYAITTREGDLRDFTKAMNAALNGRGGGKPAFVQGSVAADQAAIRAYFGKENR